MNTARLELPPQKSFLEPAVSFILSYAARFARGEAEQKDLRLAFCAALEMVLENNAHSGSEEPVAVEGKRGATALHHPPALPAKRKFSRRSVTTTEILCRVKIISI